MGNGMFTCRSEIHHEPGTPVGDGMNAVTIKAFHSLGGKSYSGGGLNIGVLLPENQGGAAPNGRVVNPENQLEKPIKEIVFPRTTQDYFMPIYIDPKIRNNG